jgi:dephospho-CoA kinase
VIDADAIARRAVDPGTDAHAAIAQRWPRVITADGSIDREALATIVFSDESERKALNAIVHPAVRAGAALREREAAPDQIVVHEIPLLFETGQSGFFDAVVLVTAPREQRIERVVKRSGLDRDEVVRRMGAQIHPDEARRLATFTIENTGSIAELRREAQRVFDALSNLSRSTE